MEQLTTNEVVPKGELFSEQSHLAGPFIKRRNGAAGKQGKERSTHTAFLIENNRRNLAVKRPEESNININSLGSEIIWMDDIVTKDILIDDYALIRIAFAQDGGNNWTQVISTMKLHHDRILIQLYGLRCFAKGIVPIDETSGMLAIESKNALDSIELILENKSKTHRLTHIYFGLEALHNIFAIKAGRVEYFNTNFIQAVGFLRQKAIQNFYKYKLDILNYYLQHIPTEEIIFLPTEYDEAKSIITPTSRGCDIVALSMECLTSLCRDSTTQEMIGEYSSAHIIDALTCCIEDPTVTLCGLKLLYAICYRNESGQAALLNIPSIQIILQNAKDAFSGDRVVATEIMRVGESLKPDGWRGLVET